MIRPPVRRRPRHLDESTAGTVSGYDVLPDEDSEVYLNVTGSTRPGSLDLTLADAYDDSLHVSATVEGQVLRGTWRYPARAMSGSVRIAEQENLDLLAMREAHGVAPSRT